MEHCCDTWEDDQVFSNRRSIKAALLLNTNVASIWWASFNSKWFIGWFLKDLKESEKNNPSFCNDLNLRYTIAPPMKVFFLIVIKYVQGNGYLFCPLPCFFGEQIAFFIALTKLVIAGFVTFVYCLISVFWRNGWEISQCSIKRYM